MAQGLFFQKYQLQAGKRSRLQCACTHILRVYRSPFIVSICHALCAMLMIWEIFSIAKKGWQSAILLGHSYVWCRINQMNETHQLGGLQLLSDPARTVYSWE